MLDQTQTLPFRREKSESDVLEWNTTTLTFQRFASNTVDGKYFNRSTVLKTSFLVENVVANTLAKLTLLWNFYCCFTNTISSLREPFVFKSSNNFKIWLDPSELFTDKVGVPTVFQKDTRALWHNINQCGGSGMFIPDPGSWFLPIPDPGSRIPDPKTATTERWKKLVVIPFYAATNFTKL